MRRFLLLLLLCLSIPSDAQEEGWPIVENCLGDLPYPTIPQEDWDFEGVIFNYNGEGVRAIRTDVGSSYFIAFENGEDFPAVGGFSPDGHWFAYPTGSTNEDINMSHDTGYGVMGITIASTSPSNERQDFELPIEYPYISIYASQTFGNRYAPYLIPLIWKDSDELLFFGDVNYPFELSLHPSTGEMLISEDFDQELVDIALHNHLWLPDLSGYFSVSSTDNLQSLLLLAPDGTQLDLLAQFNYFRAFALSPNGSFLAYIAGATLYLANVNEEQIDNLCIELPYLQQAQEYSEIFFSPDSQYLAFLYDGYPVLLNLGTREMQILRYETESLMGWYPLEERYD